jgi:hypothetical protein
MTYEMDRLLNDIDRVNIREILSELFIYLFILIGTDVIPESNFIRRHQTADLYL